MVCRDKSHTFVHIVKMEFNINGLPNNAAHVSISLARMEVLRNRMWCPRPIQCSAIAELSGCAIGASLT
jgi:hypothetical protein